MILSTILSSLTFTMDYDVSKMDTKQLVENLKILPQGAPENKTFSDELEKRLMDKNGRDIKNQLYFFNKIPHNGWTFEIMQADGTNNDCFFRSVFQQNKQALLTIVNESLQNSKFSWINNYKTFVTNIEQKDFNKVPNFNALRLILKDRIARESTIFESLKDEVILIDKSLDQGKQINIELTLILKSFYNLNILVLKKETTNYHVTNTLRLGFNSYNGTEIYIVHAGDHLGGHYDSAIIKQEFTL